MIMGARESSSYPSAEQEHVDVAEVAKHLFYHLSRVRPAARRLPTMVPDSGH